MNRAALGLVVFPSALLFSAGLVQAEKEKTPAAAEQAAPAVDPAMAKAMEAMQKAGAVGEAHKLLEHLAGEWNYTGQWWLAPGAPAQTMTGTATHTLIFGGRFLKQEIHAEATKDMPAFKGMGIIGYDNMRQEYQSIWLDNMATGIMTGSGPFDAASKSVAAKGDFSCPLSGDTHRKYRSAWKVTDADSSTYESYFYTPEGVEFKAMEIKYTRQSAPCPTNTERC